MISGFEQQTEREAAYNKYLSYCTGEPENVFEILYNTLSTDFKTTKEVLGEYFFDKYIHALRDNLDNIEKEINFYEGLLFSEGDDSHGYYTHFKPLLEKRISELILPQPGAVKFEILKNPHETIFKDAFAFAIFDKMKTLFTGTKTPQADYSFLFDIMQKDGFVICSGAKFIDFLKEFDISLTKIDSFKTGNKQKTMLYNATKENLQKKHGLSTL